MFKDFQLRKVKRILKKINALKEKMESLSDQELASKTVEFRQRLAEGETLDDILVEALQLFVKRINAYWACFPMMSK